MAFQSHLDIDTLLQLLRREWYVRWGRAPISEDPPQTEWRYRERQHAHELRTTFVRQNEELLKSRAWAADTGLEVTTFKVSEIRSMSTAPVHRPFLVHRGLHLVPKVVRRHSTLSIRSNELYKIAAVGAALFLVATVL